MSTWAADAAIAPCGADQMRRVDVALLFENAPREIEIACALKYILARRHGLTMEILQQNNARRRIVRDIRPTVVVLPYCYHERSNNRFLVGWNDATFFNLTWEQLFYPGNAAAKTPRGEFAVRHVIHNAWSEAYADVLRAQGVPEQNIFVSGNPAYTLYDEPYRRYYKSRATLASENGLDAQRRWVYFPENYNWAFYGPAMLEQMISDGQSAEQVYAMRDLVTGSFEAAMRWCATLAARGDTEVIIRPRPSTDPGEFRQRVTDILSGTPPRISIVQNDTVRDWVLASDVVVSSYSTTMIEASVAGKPAFMIEPVDLPASLHQVWHSLVPRLRTEDAFIAATTDPSAGPDADLSHWARSLLMSKGDSILLIADRLAGICRREVPIPEPAPWRSVTLPGRLPIPRRLQFELRQHIAPLLPGRPESAPWIMKNVAALSEVPDRVRRWDSLLDGYLASLGDPGTTQPRSGDL